MDCEGEGSVSGIGSLELLSTIGFEGEISSISKLLSFSVPFCA